MAKTLQLRRGDTTTVAGITGAAGEPIVDTTLNTITIHDGSTQGGTVLAKQSDLNTVDTKSGAAFNTANTAKDNATAAFSAGNTTTTYAQSAYGQANASTILAQAAFDTANSAGSAGGGGGGSGTMETLTTTPTSKSFKRIAIPSAVSYVPPMNYSRFGSFHFTDSSNTSTTYAQSYEEYVTCNIVYPYDSNSPDAYQSGGSFGLTFGNSTAIPTKMYNILTSLTAGQSITLRLATINDSSQLDYWDLTCVVKKPARSWAAWSLANPSNAYTYSNIYDFVTNSNHNSSVSMANLLVIAFDSAAIKKTQLGKKYNTQFYSSWTNGAYIDTWTIFGQYQGNGNTYGGVNLGIYEIVADDPATGTVVTFSSKSQYDNAIYYSRSLTGGNSNNVTLNYITPYIASNNQLVVSKANLVANLTNQYISAYRGVEYSPIISAGNTLKAYENNLDKSVYLSDVKLTSVSNFQNVATVSSVGTKLGTINWTNTSYVPIETYTTHSDPAFRNGYAVDQRYGPNTDGYGKLINLDDDLFNAIHTPGTPVIISYNYNGTSIVDKWITYDYGYNGTYIYGYWGSDNSAGKWVSMTMQGQIVNGSNTGPNWQQFDYTAPTSSYAPLVYSFTDNVLCFNVSTQDLNNVSVVVANTAVYANTMYVENTAFTASVDYANNNIITNLSNATYGNVNFTGSSLYTYKSGSKSDYALISDIINNLPTYVTALDNDSNKTNTGYYVGGGTGGIKLRTWNFNTVWNSGEYSQQRAGFVSQSYVNPFTYAPEWRNKYSNSWTQNSLYSYSLGVKGGIWTDGLYANNALIAQNWISSNLATFKTANVGKVTIDSSTSPNSYPNANIANVAILLSPYPLANGNTSIVYNAAPNGGQLINCYSQGTYSVSSWSYKTYSNNSTIHTNQTNVPDGAPSWARSILVGQADLLSNTNGIFTGNPVNSFNGRQADGFFWISNPNSFNIGQTRKWTLECWAQPATNDNSIYFLRGLGKSAPNASSGAVEITMGFPFYSYINLNGGGALNQYCGSVMTGYNSNSYFPAKGEWTHYVFMRDDKNFHCWINGIYQGRNEYSSAYSQEVNSSSMNFGIGCDSPTYFYNYRLTVGNKLYANNDIYQNIRQFVPDTTPFGNTTVYVASTDTSPEALDLRGGMKIQNTLNAPSDSFANGGYLYAQSGALYYKGSNGTVTTIASA